MLRRTVAVAVMVVAALPAAVAAPLDPFIGSSPHSGSRAPDARASDGDWSVSDQSGAASYAIPIAVPPGRLGMAPSLALRYSSAGALRGELAAGWTLDVPSIELDRTQLRKGTVFRAAVGEASGELVPVNDATVEIVNATAYRVAMDESFTRFEYVPACAAPCRPGWLAMKPDGTRLYFDQTPAAADAGRRWNLTEQLDPHGNSIAYVWETVTIDGAARGRRLARIEYTANAVAGIAAHAKVELGYAALEQCTGATAPIGATVEIDRGGKGRHYESPSRLLTITSSVRIGVSASWRLARRTTLGYDTAALACNRMGAPLRVLTRVDNTAWDATGFATLAPPITLGYGRFERLFDDLQGRPVGGAPEAGSSDGSTRRRLDLNGDGVRDQLEVVPTASGCRLKIWWGLRGGWSNPNTSWSLPSMPWANAGGPIVEEMCSLDGQRTLYSMLDDPNDHCLDQGTTLGYRWIDWDNDGDTDIVANLWYDKHHFDPDDVDHPPSARRTLRQPPGDPTDCNEKPPIPEMTDGFGGKTYYLRVYQNLGDRFQSVATKIKSPYEIGLPGGRALDVNVSAPDMVPDLADLDGDGFVDLIHRAALNGLPPDIDTPWGVIFGHGGHFGTEDDNPAQPWNVPDKIVAKAGLGGRYYSDGTGEGEHHKLSTAYAVSDVNGDGLPDLIVQSAQWTYTWPGGAVAVPDNTLIAFLNAGDGFADEPLLLDTTGALDVNQMDISEKVITTEGYVAKAGNSGSRRRLVDVDADGFVDLLLLPANESNILDHSGTAQVQLGNGDGFLPAVPFHARAYGPALVRAGKGLRNAQNYLWKATSEIADFDGDGLVEPIEYASNNIASYRTESLANGPMRLLTRVENGRGAVTRFDYEPTSEWQTVDLAAMPLPGVRWVVSKVTTSPGNTPSGAAQPDAVTTYGYGEPVFGSETGVTTDGVRFLGFRSVTTDHPGNRRTVRRYDYALPGAGSVPQDRRGHLVTTETYTWDQPQYRHELVTYETQAYTTYGLFGGATIATLPTTALTRTCDLDVAAPSLDVCRTQSHDVARRSTEWSGRTLNGVIRLYVATASGEGLGLAPSATSSDRRTTTSHELRYGQAPYYRHEYRILPTHVELRQRDASGTWTRVGHSVNDYGPNGRLESTSVDVVTTSSDGAAVTSYTYDAFGNVATTTRPGQQASGLASSVSYDAYGIYPASLTNELGQTRQESYEIATGALKSWSGPNRADVTCNGRPCGAAEGETFVHDGFGRVLSRRVAMGTSFARIEVEKATYDDVAIPNRVTTQRLIDGTDWTTSTVFIDGLGRTVQRRTPVTGKADSIERWAYDAAGNRVRHDLPDPQVDTGALVSYTWSFDAIGRLVAFRRPDGTGADAFSAGLAARTRQFTNDASVGMDTTRIVDPLGRLVEVREHVAGAADAVTRYGYDARDALASVVDADGNRTDLEHDARGNRVVIRRGARTWNYGYDVDGNLSSVRAPVPVGAQGEAYTTRMTYDALGRLQTRTPARRGMSDATLDQLGIGITDYTYDVGAHAIGRVGSVEVQRWASGSPSYAASYGYDARGLTAAESRTVNVLDPQPVTATASVVRSYNALGQPSEAQWDDGQRWRRTYDDRGQLKTVSRWDGAGWQTISTIDHALNGLPRSRVSLGGQRLDTTFDVLGRAKRTQVTVPGVQTPRASVDYVYQGDLNLKSKAGQTAGLVIAGDYAYDGRGRLSFAQGPDGRFGAYEYSAAGNITQLETSDGDDITELTYSYGAVDPQAVDVMRRPNGSAFASFDYDRSGNATRRVVPGGTYDLTWDGQDRLRAVNGPAGRETYLYDEAGNRVAVGEPGGARVWFAEMELRVNADSEVTRRYLHLADDSGALARVENGTVVEIQYADALQSLMLALDDSGQPTAAFTYDSFGENLASIGDADHRRQFNGKESDARTGLRYYGYRYYDPVARRWTAADPLFRFAPDVDLGQPQHQNLYAFSLNNPIRYYDPDGRKGLATTRPNGKSPIAAEKTSITPGINYEKDWNDSGGKVEARVAVGVDKVSIESTASMASKEMLGGHVTATAPSVSVSTEIGFTGVEARAELSLGKIEATTTPMCFMICVEVKGELNAGIQVGGKLGVKGAGLAFPGGAIEIDLSVEKQIPMQPAINEAIDIVDQAMADVEADQAEEAAEAAEIVPVEEGDFTNYDYAADQSYLP